MAFQWRVLSSFVIFSLILVLSGVVACGGAAPAPQIVEKEVVREVPVEKVVEKEVIREVPVEKIVEKEVIKEVQVEKEVVIEKIVIATPAPVATGKLAPLPAGGKYGGELVRNSNPGEPRDLDFQSCGPGSCLITAAPVYNGLLRINPENTNEIIGDLASTWEPSDDGLSFTFRLREGIEFHDGVPFTAADVKATFDRGLDPDFHSTRVERHIKKLIKQVDLIDDRTVRFVQTSPGLLLIPTLASNWMMVVPKHVLDEDALGEKAIGTGAFKFVEWERDVELVYERNPDYFEEGLPFLDTLKILQINDRATIIGALVSDQLNMWLAAPPRPTDIEKVRQQLGDDKINAIPYPVGVNQTFIFNTQRPPFDDIRVRRAIFLALDRQDYLDKVWRGQGVAGAVLDPAIYGDVALSLEEVNQMPGVRQPKDQDLAEAKRLLAEAGFPDGFKLEDNECLGQNTAQGRLYMEVPIAQLRTALNIECDIVLQDRPSVFARVAEGDFTLYGHGSGVQFKDADSIFGLIIAPDAGRNWGRWEHPEFTKLYNEQLNAIDVDRRRELHLQMQKFVYEVDTGHVPMTWNHAVNLVRSEVKGWHSLGPWFEHNRMDRVWIDKGN